LLYGVHSSEIKETDSSNSGKRLGPPCKNHGKKEDRTYRELSERVKNLKEKPSNNSSQEDHSSLEMRSGKIGLGI
jgi:hypothetical protein